MLLDVILNTVSPTSKEECGMLTSKAFPVGVWWKCVCVLSVPQNLLWRILFHVSVLSKWFSLAWHSRFNLVAPLISWRLVVSEPLRLFAGVHRLNCVSLSCVPFIFMDGKSSLILANCSLSLTTPLMVSGLGISMSTPVSCLMNCKSLTVAFML